MKKILVAGNWKMNKNPAEAAELARALACANNKNADVLLCVPFVDIHAVREAVAGTEIRVGAQNLYFEDSGAYTGEISAPMLVGCGVSFVIVGHSERRQYFSESDETVNKKAAKAVGHGLIPIICVGENLSQREQGITFDLLRMQVKLAYQGLVKEQAQKTVIAYEPVWAIGTGVVASSAQAQEACYEIRKVIENLYGDETAESIRILYGGSVSAANSSELFSMPDIDGGLIGGASLKPEFLDIIENAGGKR